MGRTIDRLATAAVTAFVLYLFFITSYGRILPALIATFAAMVLLRKLFAHMPSGIRGRKRRALRKSADILEHLSLADTESAQTQLCALIRSACHAIPEDAALHCILRHPSSDLSADDIISVWRQHRDSEHVLAVALSNADTAAFSLAARLKSPCITIIDGNSLQHLIVSSNATITTDSTYIKEHTPECRHIRMLRAAGKACAGKCALTGALMLAIYIISGAIPYMFGSLILFFIAGISIKHRRAPTEFFIQ